MVKATLVLAAMVTGMFLAQSTEAAVSFTEDFAALSDTVVNDWNTGDNGWTVTEPHYPNRATADGTAGGGRIFGRSDFGTTTVQVEQDFTATPMATGTVEWDYMDGTGNSDLRLLLQDSVGTVALKLFFFPTGGSPNLELGMYATNAPNAGDFVTAADSVQVRDGHSATITVDFDVNTDTVTVSSLSTDGDSTGPVTFAMFNTVSDISFVSWNIVPQSAPGSELNTTLMTITGTEVPEPASLVLTGLGAMMIFYRRRAVDR